MDQQTLSIIIAIAGCFVGLAGWLSKRDDKIGNDSQWKGEVSEALKQIKNDTSDLPDILHRLTKVEASSEQAHKRINEYLQKDKYD